MLDEPSLGLAPRLVDEVLDTVRQLKAEGMTILLVEQNVREALEIADRAYVLQTGRAVLEGTGEELLKSDMVRKARGRGRLDGGTASGIIKTLIYADTDK